MIEKAKRARAMSVRFMCIADKLNADAIDSYGIGFSELCDQIGSSHELSLAKDRIEEAMMWALKHIANCSNPKP